MRRKTGNTSISSLLFPGLPAVFLEGLSAIFRVLCVPLLVIGIAGCPDDGITPPASPLQVVDVTCTEVSLNISLAGSDSNSPLTLKRGDSVILSDLRLLTSDTLFTDSLLLPNRTYTYTLTDGNWRASIQATTLDTSSHDIQWQTPDTLGIQGLIRDVWVFSQDNAWAVGEIYLADSAGTPDMGNPYNAAHWDGSKWKIEQIPTAGFVGSGYYPIYTIFAFAPNDIWTFSEAGSYSHWNGQTWTTAFVAERQGGGQKLWGTSSSNLFLVGTNGSISRYNGSTWTKMESYTTVNLQDIWGIDNEHIWATGFNNNDGHCVLLQYDGKQWSTIYDNANSTPSTLQYFNTLWTNNVNYLYLDGGSYTRFLDLRNGSFNRTDSMTEYTVSRLRGIKRNDIIRVGFGGETVHFNGYSWNLYPELKLLNQGFAGFTSVYPTRDFVLIGGLYLTALNGFPVVVRGYR